MAAAAAAAVTGSIAGCGQPAPACELEAEPSLVLFRSISFARVDAANVSEGFDLDGRVSDRSDLGSCRKPDFTSPDGTPGIDNQIAVLLPIIEMQTGGLRLDDVLQTAIDNGQLLIAFELLGVDDPVNDPCVTVRLRPVVGTPLLGTDGRVLPGQTFDVAPDGEVSTIEGGRIVDGVLAVGPAPVALPVQVLDARFTLHVEGAQVRLERNEDGTWRGLLGGGISVEEMIQIARGLNIPSDLMGAVMFVLRSNADLARDEAGDCQQISATLVVDGVPAFLYE
ncbi:MAG: hypothetical protein OHK0013_39310 [Sandaracinaceae bacterium]